LKSTEAFLIIYATFIFSTVIVLSLLGLERIDVYVALFAIEFFVACELTSPFGPSESLRKTVIGILLLAIFAGIVVERVVEILR